MTRNDEYSGREPAPQVPPPGREVEEVRAALLGLLDVVAAAVAEPLRPPGAATLPNKDTRTNQGR
jgi:hypothetical protein